MRSRARCYRARQGERRCGDRDLVALPIAFIVLSSLKPGREIFAVPPKLFFSPTLRHYVTLWDRWGGFFDGLRNSLVVTVGAAPGSGRQLAGRLCLLAPAQPSSTARCSS